MSQIVTSNEIKGKSRPPGIGWILFIVLVSLLTIAAFGVGLRGHLNLLKSRAQWESMAEERGRLTSQVAELQAQTLTAEALLGVAQSNLVNASSQLAAKKAELTEAENARVEAENARRKAEDAQAMVISACARIKGETETLSNKVLDLQDSTNTLTAAADSLERRVVSLRGMYKSAETNLVITEASTSSAKRSLLDLTGKMQKAQEEWERVSKQLAEATAKLAAAQAGLVSAADGKKTADKDRLQIKADADKEKADLDAAQSQLEKVRQDLAKERSSCKVAGEQADMARKEAALSEAKRDAAKDALQKIDADRVLMQGQVDALAGQTASLQKSVDGKKTELARLEEDAVAASKKCEDARIREAQALAAVAVSQKRLEELRGQETDQLKAVQNLKDDIKKLQENLRNLASAAPGPAKADEKAK